MRHAIKSIDQHLNAHWGPYRIYIITAKDYQLDDGGLDGPYTDEDLELIWSWAKNSTVQFLNINMYSEDALEPGFNTSQFKRWNQNLDGGTGGRQIGYRSMCRLFSWRLQRLPLLQRFKYYMRMDDDAIFTGDLKSDPFKDMDKMNLTYAYRRTAWDHWGIDHMWKLALPHMNETQIRNMQKMGFVPRGDNPVYDGWQPYNNFHVATVELFQQSGWSISAM